MVSKLALVIYTVSTIIVSANCGSMSHHKDQGPILIKSLSYRKSDSSQTAQSERADRSQRPYYYSGNANNNNRGETYKRGGNDNEKGQILHRPKTSDRNSPKSQQLPAGNDNGPIILNGRGKGVKYVPVPSGGNQQGQNRPPSVYVIKGGNDDEDDEDQGMMGSMQSYFRSMTGRIKSAMKGFIGSSD